MKLNKTFGLLMTLVMTVIISIARFPNVALAIDCNGNGVEDLADIHGTLDTHQLHQFGSGNNTIRALAIADFDGDTMADVASPTLENLYVWLQQGLSEDGVPIFGAPLPFQNEQVFATSATTGDFNEDGRIDIAIYSRDSKKILVFLNAGNAGNGTWLGFRAPLSIQLVFNGTGGSGLSSNIMSVDVDRDGNLDLATTNYSASDGKDITVLRNQGLDAGNNWLGFGTPIYFSVGAAAGNGSASADFNNDGYTDIAIKLAPTNTFTIMLNNRTNGNEWLGYSNGGTFGTGCPVDAQFIDAGDINNDQRPDMVLRCSDFTTVDKIAVTLNGGVIEGNLTFPTSLLLSTNQWNLPRIPAFADINGDGYLDIALTAGRMDNGVFVSENKMLVFINKRNENFLAPLELPVGDYAFFVKGADINGDGISDLVTTNFGWYPTGGPPGSVRTPASISMLIGRLPQSQDVNGNDIPDECENHPPVLNSIANQTIDESSLLSLNVSGTDPDNQPLVLTADNLPSGANFQDYGNGAGIFSWTPNYTQAGVYSVGFKASDGALSDSKNVLITVNNVNRAPAFEALSDQSGKTGQLLTFTVKATDLDGDKIVSLKATGLPSGATFSASYPVAYKAEGVFRWTPGKTQRGTYTVSFKATDSYGKSGEQVIRVVIV